jgi:membrane protein YqaA with SNARE-associated domain
MDPQLKKSLVKMGWATLALLLVVIALGALFREQLQHMSETLVAVFGYPGIGIGIFCADAFTLPIPPDFYLMLAVAAQMDPLWVTIVGSIGSILGGITAFALGRLLTKASFVQRLVAPFQVQGEAFINRFGVMAVILAALTPIPFSMVCILAGMMGMAWRLFLPATLFRIPRIAGYYFLIHIGWSVAVGL